MSKPLEFSSLPLSLDLIEVAAELGFKSLTPIQAMSIPPLLNGQDVVGQSSTGSGKTAAFALPILQKIDLKSRHVQAVILCPTRELCAQVAREIRKLGRRHSGLQVLVISGGQPIGPQFSSLEMGVHLVVGTPGRVLDHLKRKSLDLRRAATVVLDEADRMLDMGFQEEMEKILALLPKKRQTVFFSATFPKTIEAMSRAYQQSPVRVTVEQTKQNEAPIRQLAYEVDPEVRLKALLWLIQQHQPASAVIFCNFKNSVADLERALKSTGASVASIHGDLEQNERDRVMAKFRNQSVRFLVATDVAARGIDVEALDAVINFELPAQPEIYVHRIGRTGRAGQKGLALSLFTSREKSKLQAIENYSDSLLQRKTIPPGLDRAESSQLQSGVEGDAMMETLFIAGGRKEKMRPGDILGALTGEAGGLDGTQVGKIEIHDHFSYVAVAKNIAQVAMQRLRDGRIKGRKFRIERVR